MSLSFTSLEEILLFLLKMNKVLNFKTFGLSKLVFNLPTCLSRQSVATVKQTLSFLHTFYTNLSGIVFKSSASNIVVPSSSLSSWKLISINKNPKICKSLFF